eukprot:2360866-Pleurochrysis_carterae.AAC.1
MANTLGTHRHFPRAHAAGVGRVSGFRQQERASEPTLAMHLSHASPQLRARLSVDALALGKVRDQLGHAVPA